MSDLRPIPANAESYSGPWDHCQSGSDGECIWKRCPQKVEYLIYCKLARADEDWLEANGHEIRR
jgi:hypothetical protein